jgi:hypothetical protein
VGLRKEPGYTQDTSERVASSLGVMLVRRAVGLVFSSQHVLRAPASTTACLLVRAAAAAKATPGLRVHVTPQAWRDCSRTRLPGVHGVAVGHRLPLWAVPGAAVRSMSDGPGDQPAPEAAFDPELLRALEIDHVPPANIAEALKSENITLEQLKMLVDEGFHLSSDGRPQLMNSAEQAALSRNAKQWSVDLVHQLNPRRRFFPGQTYLPEELSPHYEADYAKLREENRKLGCPLGGKKGPKIDYTNVVLLSRCDMSVAFQGHRSLCKMSPPGHTRRLWMSTALSDIWPTPYRDCVVLQIRFRGRADHSAS